MVKKQLGERKVKERKRKRKREKTEKIGLAHYLTIISVR